MNAYRAYHDSGVNVLNRLSVSSGFYKNFILVQSFFMLFSFISGETLFAKSYKKFGITVPLLTSGREGTLGVLFNLYGQASLELNYNSKALGEDLTKKERDLEPGASLKIFGKEYSVLIQRFSNPMSMSGFFWGVGAGYQKMKADWTKSPEAYHSVSGENINYALNEEGKVLHHLESSGVTANLKGGYRYVSDNLGFSAGLYLKIRHFQNNVKRAEGEFSNSHESNELHSLEEKRLKRRLMTSVLPIFEFGWLF